MKAKVVRAVLIVLVPVVIVGLAFLALWILSPGRPVPLTGKDGRVLPGSVSEKVFIDIPIRQSNMVDAGKAIRVSSRELQGLPGHHGVQQGMFIRGRDPSGPVLLYLHGGLPETFLTDKYPTGLETLFTVVWWEQRGSGISYHDNVPTASVNLEQLVSDTLVVTDYLRNRFHKEKIYLMGHSGGSFLGAHVAARAPEKYAAYIAVAQISNQLQSEIEAYQYILAEYRRTGDQSMVGKLEAAPVTSSGLPDEYLKIRDEAMHDLGVGTMRSMRSVVSGIFLPSLLYPGYTLPEKIRLWVGKSKFGVGALFARMLETDLSKTITKFELPVYFFHGIFDKTCSYKLARGYFDQIDAPVKGFYTFAASAHSPIFEEPDHVTQIMERDVLLGETRMADKQGKN